jgi:phage terminase small subunit
MTNKQKIFVKEYLIDLNATQAAIRAGYSKKTAYSHGQRLLKHVEIQNLLTSAMHKREEKAEITAERVLKELALIGFADQADYFEIYDDGSLRVKQFEEMPEGASRVISGIEEIQRIMGSGEGGKDMVLEARRKLRHHDKVRALELIGNHLGMWKDRNEVIFPDVETFELPKLVIPGINGNNGGNGNGGNGNGGSH